MNADGYTRVLDLAQSCLEDPSLDADAFAGRAHLSRFHFDRLVSAAYGEPPGALRRRLMLERAAYRLLRSDATVLDVAVEAGYGSHEAFTRAFGRAYGVSPTGLRNGPAPLTFRDLELPAPSGVHFQPPGGIRLPAHQKETGMDVVQQLVDHHVDGVTTLIERAATLDDADLDRTIEMSVEGIDAEPSLRTLINAMVAQEEHWLSALRGGKWPDESDQSVAGLASRHRSAGRDYREFVARALSEGTLGDTFIDTTCDPPIAHTLGGTIAHVITFGAVRRVMAAGALESLGDNDVLDVADPRPRIDARAGGGGGGSSLRFRR